MKDNASYSLRATALTAATLLLFNYAVADNTPSDNENPHLSTKTPYPYVPVTYTPAPEGYQPVFINYVGRHGSRHLSSAKYDKTLSELLELAEQEEQLTEEGQALQQHLRRFMEVESGLYGELSISGADELKGIGQRVGEQFGEIFDSERTVLAYATYKDRAPQSRDHFLEGLRLVLGEHTPPIISQHYEKGSDPYLRPYDLATRYQDYKDEGEWTNILGKYLEEQPKNPVFAREILTQIIDEELYTTLSNGELEFEDDKGRVKLNSPEDAVNNLYQLYIISSNLKNEGTFDFGKYFTEEQLAWYENLDILETYYSKGPSLTSTDAPQEIIAPLVKELLVSTDNALKTGDISGIFRFAHAETIIPLSAYLDIAGANKSSDNPANVAALWKGAEITPMGANIQWVLYKRDENYLIKMLRNEQEIAFPIPTDNYPYYAWEDVKNYFTEKLHNSGVDLESTLENNIELLIEKF